MKGDLGYAQRMALVWLMDREIEDTVELEKFKAQTTALANHPSTQSDFLKNLFHLDEEEEFSEENVEWITPQSEAELEELNRILNGING